MKMKSHWMVAAGAGLIAVSAWSPMANAFANGNAPAPSTPASASQSAPEASAGLSNGTVLLIQLSKSVDTKNAKAGDEVTAKLVSDVKADGKVVLHQGTKLIGHVAQARAHSKETPGSTLTMVFEKAVAKGGVETVLSVNIQAVGAPPLPAMSSNINPDLGVPTSMGSQGSRVSTAPPSGMGPASSGPMSRPAGGVTDGAVNTGVSANGVLTPSSKGVFGISDVSLAAATDASQPPVLQSAGHNIKLESGTQILLVVSA
ncbi:MAG: hypothetical protein ACHP79_10100, partial [Terriglobales bacterium]